MTGSLKNSTAQRCAFAAEDSPLRHTTPKSPTQRHLSYKLFFVVLMLCVVPILSEKHQHNINSRTNSIDRRKTASSDEVETPSDEESSHPQIGCKACKMHKEIKERNIQHIRADILNRLGFEKPPNMTGKFIPNIPPHLLAMYDQSGMQSDEPMYKTGPSVSEEVDDFHVKTEKIITFAQLYPRLRHSWRDHGILYFPFTDSASKYVVGSASLYVYVHGAERRPVPSFYVEVHRVYRSQDHQDTPATKKIAWAKVQQPLGKGDWVRVDVTSVVSEWFKSPKDNLGIIVGGTVNGKKVVVTDTQQELGTKVPYIEVTTKEGKRRTRRHVGMDCDAKSNETICCRYPQTVDFERINFDFIIAPKKFEAHYCAGECPFFTQQRHPHTHLMAMTASNVVPTCCTPRKLSSISMLYFDEKLNVMLGTLPGMVVERCGCA